MAGSSKHYKIALIAKYPKVAELFSKVTKELNIESYNIFASLEEAAEAARKIRGKADAILSRGVAVNYIKEVVDIPVVQVPITPFDVIQVVHGLDDGVKEVALINGDIIPEISVIEEMYGIKIRQYTLAGREDIIRAVVDAKERGIRHVTGGQVTCNCAASLGLRGYLKGVICAGHSQRKQPRFRPVCRDKLRDNRREPSRVRAFRI